MSEVSTNNKRIAKNTIFMYIRMGIVMLVQLYTSRIVLNSLGIDDYGIYNVVGSFVVAFTFISGPLGTATQRFLNFELGKRENSQLNVIFNLSFYSYLLLGLILFIVIEIAGEWYIHEKMILPPGRLEATEWAFQLSLLSLILGLFKTPFESSIVAYEKMSFYAYLGIAEVVLKLLNALSLEYIMVDKLKLYSVNQLAISAIVLLSTYLFCAINFKELRLKALSKVWDTNKFKELVSFSGWSLFGSVASMTANQGLNLLLNLFYGVAVNAAMGIANQINASVVQFVSNFQIAFRPQIVKSYASNNIGALRTLIFRTSKFSYLLLFAIVCPLCFNMQFILELWLKHPPVYAAEFSILVLVYALTEALSAPMWMTVQATGRIKKYQIVISSIILMNIILSYVFLKLGSSPLVVLEIKCVLDLLYLAVRLLFMRNMVGLNVKSYLKDVIKPVMLTSILSLSLLYIFLCLSLEGWQRLLYTVSVFVISYPFLVMFIGMTSKERYWIREKIYTQANNVFNRK